MIPATSRSSSRLHFTSRKNIIIIVRLICKNKGLLCCRCSRVMSRFTAAVRCINGAVYQADSACSCYLCTQEFVRGLQQEPLRDVALDLLRYATRRVCKLIRNFNSCLKCWIKLPCSYYSHNQHVLQKEHFRWTY